MMGRSGLSLVNLRPQHCRACLIATCLVSLGLMTTAKQTRADVPPPDEDACSGEHRAGDRCVAETEEVDSKRLEGTCQTSLCPRWKREPIPCLKCVPNRAATENSTARGGPKKNSNDRGRTSTDNSCSLSTPGSALRGITLWLAAGVIATLFLATRRRRR
jgi:hypothetical protein